MKVCSSRVEEEVFLENEIVEKTNALCRELVNNSSPSTAQSPITDPETSNHAIWVRVGLGLDSATFERTLCVRAPKVCMTRDCCAQQQKRARTMIGRAGSRLRVRKSITYIIDREP